jgi:hypothetical protein
MKAILFAGALVAVSLAHGQSLTGAWRSTTGDEETVLIFAAQHFSRATYNRAAKTFTSTEGGSSVANRSTLTWEYEFNTLAPEKIGAPEIWKFQLKQDVLTLTNEAGTKAIFQRVDAGAPGALAGAWLITGRVTDKGMQSITPGARKTMKILSGTRFQWIAYNSETKEFFGTGGGTYTSENGKYTETIEFFSRDNSRVGMQLSFDFSLPEGNWRHSGKSSKGDPIDEVWTLREKLKL